VLSSNYIQIFFYPKISKTLKPILNSINADINVHDYDLPRDSTEQVDIVVRSERIIEILIGMVDTFKVSDVQFMITSHATIKSFFLEERNSRRSKTDARWREFEMRRKSEDS
jgi:hypothetical protein